MPPVRAAPSPAPRDYVARMIAKDEGDAFKHIFKDAELTTVEKVKQWIKVVVYSCGKIVGRLEKMTEANLAKEMNKAYYLRLQVIFADVESGQSYWSNHFGFDCSFTQMMTYTFGCGSAPPALFFDYENNEHLNASQVEGSSRNWSSAHLWTKYGEIKTEMIGHMLPLLLKQRVHYNSSIETYEFPSGGNFAELTWGTLGALFQVHA